MVYLLRHSRNKKLPNIRTNKPSNKLNFKKLRPFKILKKISKVNYKLNLPKNIRPINVINRLGQASNSRIRRQQGNLTSGLRFMFLALNPFQLFQIIQPPRNRTLHPP
ncbi:hypothetical protein MKX08_003185 [Trichoderma sp. CBMAI-0020]|nr:hypothetical protein MKX08_003185 [Trichoderma sp. CBMAI-0020]